MSDAYFTATHQFTELRALHELSTIAAEQEALAHGAVFKPSVFVRLLLDPVQLSELWCCRAGVFSLLLSAGSM